MDMSVYCWLSSSRVYAIVAEDGERECSCGDSR